MLESDLYTFDGSENGFDVVLSVGRIVEARSLSLHIILAVVRMDPHYTNIDCHLTTKIKDETLGCETTAMCEELVIKYIEELKQHIDEDWHFNTGM